MNQNQNDQYKVIVKFKPLDYVPQNIQVSKDSIRIQLNQQDKNIDYEFEFQHILDEKNSQQETFEYLDKFGLEKVIDGQNVCILSYGQTTAGKTYTIFGQEDNSQQQNVHQSHQDQSEKRGLVYRTVQYLLDLQKKLESQRSLVITCSLYEIYLDQIRDLIKTQSEQSQLKQRSSTMNYSLKMQQNNYESEDLEISESTNGQILIKNLNHINIKNINDLNGILQTSFMMRSKFENQNNEISSKSHTICRLNVIQKDKENENQAFINSSVSFVDLAGSEKTAKTLNDAQKYQESLIINNNLNVLGKVLFSLGQQQCKNCPYKESKLTRVLQNSLDLQSHVILIANVNPGESCVEETINTFQFCDRTKNMDLKSKNLSQLDDMNMQMGNFQVNNKLVRKLNEEYSELKTKLESLHSDYRQKLFNLQNMLGIEYDLDKMLTKPTDKEIKIFKTIRESLNELNNKKNRKKEIEVKIDSIIQKIEHIKQEDNMKSDKYITQIKYLQEQNYQLKDYLVEQQQVNEEQLKVLEKNRRVQIDEQLQKSQVQIEKESNILFNRAHMMQNYQQEFMKVVNTKRQKKQEEDKIYRQMIQSKKSEYQQKTDQMSQKYQETKQIKENEIQKYYEDVYKFKQEWNEKLEQMRNEIIHLFHICQMQKTVILKTETGSYNNGIKNCYIPKKEIPIFPNPNKFAYLEKLLEQRKILRNLQQDNKQDQLRKTYTKMNEQINVIQFKNNQQSIKNEKISLNVKEEKLNYKDQITYCQKARDNLKELIQKSEQLEQKMIKYEAIDKQHDIQKLIEERDKYKDLYLNQWKHNNKQRMQVEGQRNVMSNTSNKYPKISNHMMKNI